LAPCRFRSFAMSDVHAHPRTTGSAAQRPPLRRRLPMPAYQPPRQLSEFLQRMLARAKQSLGEEFTGITTEGIVQPGLFPVRKTGISARPILQAARDFLALLDSRQRRQALFAIDSHQWHSWSNVHPFLMRHGLGLHELAPAQREAALALVSSALSGSGFETARNVMKLNEHACELTGLTDEYSEWYYGLRAGACRIRQIYRRARVPARGKRWSRHDARTQSGAAGESHHRHPPAGRGACRRLQR
jgi:Protein of unknown function (DUF3500)